VDARSLKEIFDFVFLLALSAWVGGMLFVALVAGPLVRALLGWEPTRRRAREFVPKVFQWVAIAAAVALPALVAVPLAFPEMRGPWVGIRALLVIASALAMLHTGNALVPMLFDAHEAGPEAQRRFRRLYLRAVVLSSTVLAIGVLMLFAFVIRPVPKTSGIVEPSPVERARMEAEALRVRESSAVPAAGR
jgi:uncharacterized membrane protein